MVRDYDAVMTSADRRVDFDGTGWPRGSTLEPSLIDLAWHHKNHALGVDFTYTVASHDERKRLGCVYIDPTEVEGYEGCDAEVRLWVAPTEANRGQPRPTEK